MKKNYILQYEGNEVNVVDVDADVKAILVEKGILVKDVDKVTAYFKAVDGRVNRYAAIELKTGKVMEVVL